ncbi:hypothetical protein [Nocardia crassostreae]|uniref:hypothetical protein n=1 Tax=Nocardia crassostreae TaxID=53428 RepID=UPI00082A69B8|nr:hypothetical protein [Nocardia crassostreae]
MDENAGGAMAAGTISGPPFSPELLADLHAGNIPAELSERLWSAVRRDPAAIHYLASLDRVNTRLHDLARDESIAHPMPPAVAAKLERMIDDLVTADLTATGEQQVGTVHQFRAPNRSTHPAPPPTAPMPALTNALADTGQLDFRALDDEPYDPEFAPEPPRFDERTARRLRWLTAAAAAVALLAGAVVAVDAIRSREVAPTPVPAADFQLAADLPHTDVLTAMGRHDITGPLAEGDALTDCLRATDLDRPLLGSRNVTYSGQKAVLVLLAGPEAPTITAAVLGAGCTTGNPQLLASSDIG